MGKLCSQRPTTRSRGPSDAEPSLEDYRGRSVQLLFWAPTCSFCVEMVGDLCLLAGDPERPNLLVLATGDAETNRLLELGFPVALDTNGAAAARYGVRRTPIAIL